LRPGRNVAVLLEVAALNQRLKQDGVFAARELNNRLIAKMAENKKKGASGSS
jgi:HPr kinase/phosphorylase